MNRKVILGILVVCLIIILGFGGYKMFENKKSTNNDSLINDDNVDEPNNSSSKKILVAYYSATGSTKKVAEKIANNLNADIFEIVPEEIYTSNDLDWTNSNSRVSKEHNDESLRNVKLTTTTVANWDNYDTILIGYPIWWGIAAWPVNTFVKDNNFDGKTVIPFCTSASSSLENSGKLLEDLTKTGNWQEGHRFSSSATDADIKSFTDSIK